MPSSTFLDEEPGAVTPIGTRWQAPTRMTLAQISPSLIDKVT